MCVEVDQMKEETGVLLEEQGRIKRLVSCWTMEQKGEINFVDK